MRKKHSKIIHLTKKDIKEGRHIQKTTSSYYGKKGNVDSMTICKNVTKSKYGNETILRHYRKTIGALAQYENLLK